MLITANQLAKKVKEMRDLQKSYFKDKKQSTLYSAKFTEKEVDAMIDSILKYQPARSGDLFEQK